MEASAGIFGSSTCTTPSATSGTIFEDVAELSLVAASDDEQQQPDEILGPDQPDPAGKWTIGHA